MKASEKFAQYSDNSNAFYNFLISFEVASICFQVVEPPPYVTLCVCVKKKLVSRLRPQILVLNPISDSIVSDLIVSDSIVSDSIVSDSIVSDSIVSDSIVLHHLLHRNSCIFTYVYDYIFHTHVSQRITTNNKQCTQTSYQNQLLNKVPRLIAQ